MDTRNLYNKKEKETSKSFIKMNKRNCESKKSKIVRPCPNCGHDVDFSENQYRPFCSERCKMADLGSWLKEEYYISSSLLDMEIDNEIKQR